MPEGQTPPDLPKLQPIFALFGVGLVAFGLWAGTLIQTDYNDPFQEANYLISLRPAAFLIGGLSLAAAVLMHKVGAGSRRLQLGMALLIAVAGTGPMVNQLVVEAQPTLRRWGGRYRVWQTERATARATKRWETAHPENQRRPPKPQRPPDPPAPIPVPEPSSLKPCVMQVTGACPSWEYCYATHPETLHDFGDGELAELGARGGDHRCHRTCNANQPCSTSDLCVLAPTGESRAGALVSIPLCFKGQPGPAELALDEDFAARARASLLVWRAAQPQLWPSTPGPSSLEPCDRVTSACPQDELCFDNRHPASGDHRCHRLCWIGRPCEAGEACRSIAQDPMFTGAATYTYVCFPGGPDDPREPVWPPVGGPVQRR